MGQPSSPFQPNSGSPSPSPSVAKKIPQFPSLPPNSQHGGDEEPPCSLEEEQRMASPSDLKQQLAAALHRQTPPAAAAAAPAGVGRVAPDRAAAIQLQITAQRARVTGAFSEKVALARSLSDQSLSRREQLKRLKDQLRDLQPQLREALTLKLSTESKRKLSIESTSEATASERLRSLVADARVKRDTRAATIPKELEDVESLEAESNEDAEMYKNLPKILLWFHKFLGFQVIGEEGGVRFVFDKIDPQHPDKEYSFRISEGFKLIDCDPRIRDIEELANDLDLKEDLFKFVKMAREKFQSSFMNDVSSDVSAPLPSPMVNSVNSTSEGAHSQSQSQSKNNVQLLPTKRGAATLSGASPGVLRRSPHIEGKR